MTNDNVVAVRLVVLGESFMAWGNHFVARTWNNLSCECGPRPQLPFMCIRLYSYVAFPAPLPPNLMQFCCEKYVGSLSQTHPSDY